MRQEIFNLLDQINRYGLDNSNWGLVQDIPSTLTHFGTKADLELHGQWLYLYLNDDDEDWIIVESASNPDADFALPVMGCDGEFLILYKL